MKNVRLLSILLFVFMILITECYSQNTKSDSSKVKWGFGISSTFYQNNSYDIYLGTSSSFSLPIFVSSNFKMEPFIGYYKSEYDRKAVQDTYKSKYNRIDDNLVFGAGLFYYNCIGNTKVHFGGNIGYFIYNYEYKDEDFYGNYDQKSDGTGYIISPIVGCEYFISDNFSFGAEAHFEWSSWESDGKTKYDLSSVRSPDRSEESSTTRFYTKGILVFRFYPWSSL